MTCSCSSVLQPQMRTEPWTQETGCKSLVNLTQQSLRRISMSSSTSGGIRKEHKRVRNIHCGGKKGISGDGANSSPLHVKPILHRRCKRERRSCRGCGGDPDVDVPPLRSQPLCRQQNQYSILLSISILQLKREGLYVIE